MKLSAPSWFAWLVALLCGGAGLAAKFGLLPAATPFMFWLVAAGFVVLLLATVIRGM
ncbi:MAG TPA: hypothetical protein VEY50_03265 [Lysobacter sp.]|nr:hypothetical protein [Lysobacter sp.]